jgi:hypothetical protein
MDRNTVWYTSGKLLECIGQNNQGGVKELQTQCF